MYPLVYSPGVPWVLLLFFQKTVNLDLVSAPNIVIIKDLCKTDGRGSVVNKERP